MPECLNAIQHSWKFSICTLVTRTDEYAEMVQSFRDAGFDKDCEFLFFDNSESNIVEAYSACNRFLNSASGEFIILCHQDILLNYDRRADLELKLAGLQALDPFWGVCGNAGGAGAGRRFARISDPHGDDQRRGSFPACVASLDENFIVVRRDANLALSRDLAGFHLYGTDLCLVADVLGWSAWVIDFHLTHKSGGTVGDDFHRTRSAMIKKFRRAFRWRWVTSTCTTMLLAGSLLNSPFEALFQARRRWRGRR